jgi:hypothetical protein
VFGLGLELAGASCDLGANTLGYGAAVQKLCGHGTS